MADKPKKIEKDKAKAKTGKPEAAIIKVDAKLRYLRMSPRKVRAITNAVKKMNAVRAVDYLHLVNKAAATPVYKLINSAIANGVNNFGLTKDNLYIDRIFVDEGPALKRWMPRAMGRATPIKKRSSHITVILGSKDAPQISAKKAAEKTEVKKITPEELKKQQGGQDKSDSGKGGKDEGGKQKQAFTKRLFSRKTG